MVTSNRSMTFLSVGIVTTAAILDSMRSVADDLRDDQIREMLKLTPAERMELALQLGQRAVEMYMAANQVVGLSRLTAACCAEWEIRA
jgi:hypothetical protein